MIKRFPFFMIVLMVLLTTGIGSSQEFEGVITLHGYAHGSARTNTLIIKGDKSISDMQVDSTESIRIIKDKGADMTTMLRRKDDLRYGYRTMGIMEPHTETGEHEQSLETIKFEETREKKLISGFQCTKVVLTCNQASAEAWITKELGFPLSKYYPEFLGVHQEPVLMSFRKAVDEAGFVMSYKEQMIGSYDENIITVTVEKRPVSIDEFNISDEYLVLDKESMKRLYQKAQNSEEDKKRWQEFIGLFRQN